MEEEKRLAEPSSTGWKEWGPYLSDRQWGTVREDYSAGGTAWDSFSHDQARSRAYRWGEDGMFGISDLKQNLCFALAFWNGRDPILKERLFGLTNSEGNHGEDCKERYYYLDALPTHSYLKALYKYPQREYPYSWLVQENGRRGKDVPEFELIDTGVFDDDRYFDAFVEYAKGSPHDILIKITIHNRGPEEAEIHVLPHLWFRNTWSWGDSSGKPTLTLDRHQQAVVAQSGEIGTYRLYRDGDAPWLFTDNDTNTRRLFGMHTDGYFKDAFHEYLVNGNEAAVNPHDRGTKSAAHYRFDIPARGQVVVRLRLSADVPAKPFADFDTVFAQRRREADGFYDRLQHGMTDDQRLVQRQALAGMIWSKQFFYYDVRKWLKGDPGQPAPPAERRRGRNHEWIHLTNADVISMPDKWEYPWYAAWDLAFHTIALALVDSDFAKEQLVLLTRSWYLHPNGQLPAYEWAFGDVNPPVHGWAAWRVFQIDRQKRRRSNPQDDGDLEFLERVFHKLMLNFTWWVNRKDAGGRNIFQGGFLGLDNIGVFDRSAPLPTGGYINQADGTSWMAMYSLNLMRIALELAQHNHVYEDAATKFFQHFLHIAEAMTSRNEGLGLWDDEDGFFYDELNLPDGQILPLRLRSMVGLIPLFAVETLEPELCAKVPLFSQRLDWFFTTRPELAALVSRWNDPGKGERRLMSLLRGSRMKKLLKRMLDETEFLSDYGVRAISRFHRDQPYTLDWSGQRFTVEYQPGESTSGLFGGNSNWRGPIWMPVNYLIIESLQKFHHYYGDDFKIECPTGSGRFVTIDEVASELATRLSRLFLRNADGRRPVFGDNVKVQNDPHFRDYILFHEYFHGDSGRGVGASHQTGWTGLVAKLLQPRRAAVASQQTSAGDRRSSSVVEPV
jgi:Mannosylglycerate hydrolase MGH1-like glycoside hydrolase domain/Glycosyl hydrolase family 63 C-terminal domain